MKKKLLIASDDFLPRWDGVARFLSEILDGIADEYDVTVIAPDFPGKAPEFPDINIERVPMSSITLSDYPVPKIALSKIIRGVKKAEIVWTQNLGPVGVPSILVSRLFRKPCAAYIHSVDWELYYRSLSEKNIFRGIVYFITVRLSRMCYNRCSILMVPCKGVADLVEEKGIRTPKHIVHMGINSSKFVPPKSKKDAKQRLGISPENMVVGYCGRIGREKDLITLYRAFLRLRRKKKNIKMLVVGKGVHELEALFKSKKDIIMIDYTNNVVPYLQAMDVYVLPSLTETTSLSTMEAMSCGVAVAATRVGFVKDYIKEGVNGVFFEKRDSYGLYKCILKILEDSGLRKKLGENARNYIVSNYSWEKTTEAVKKSLSELKS